MSGLIRCSDRSKHANVFYSRQRRTLSPEPYSARGGRRPLPGGPSVPGPNRRAGNGGERDCFQGQWPV